MPISAVYQPVNNRKHEIDMIKLNLYMIPKNPAIKQKRTNRDYKQKTINKGDDTSIILSIEEFLSITSAQS